MISYFSVDTNNLSIQKLVAITQLYQRDHSFSTYVNQRNVCLRTKWMIRNGQKSVMI